MDPEPNSSEACQVPDEVANLPQAYAFTVHFDNGKCSGGETTNRFAKRHIRNLSLPISKVYENKVTNESATNGRAARRAGNHSEGYFSSDPDDDTRPKLYEIKSKTCESRGFKSTNTAQEKCTSVTEKEEEASSDVASEAGTYTIDKDSPELDSARKSIDSVFGVQAKTIETKNNQVNTKHSSPAWINEWASSVVEHNHSLDNGSSSSSKNSGLNISTSKIPSPINHRSRLKPMTQPLKVEHPEPTTRPALNRKSYPVAAQEGITMETESYLRATERVVSALAARVSLSLDSGGESDAENSLGPVVGGEPGGHTDSSASDSGHTMRYNRAFSLRRGRLDDPKKKDNIASVAPTPKLKVEPVKPLTSKVVRRDPPLSSSSFSRTDCGRFSMRSPRPLPQSPLMSNAKKEVVKKKTGSGASARSNSTLSSKEVEFQNWKRRKSYDPMKAAAEGKKKEAAAKKQPPAIMTQSTNSTITTPKSPVNPVLRSASFHGTRQLVPSSSDEEEVILSAEDEDWPVLQAPRTSLENTPQGSRVSLYSNTSNSPTPPLRNRPKLEIEKPNALITSSSRENAKQIVILQGVDTLVISALSGLSSKLKGNSCNLLSKLRFLYDEDSPKNHQLSAMIDQLEASEPGSPQVKSPSRELATTLRNLKRLESMLKVLDDVLFDEEEFQ